MEAVKVLVSACLLGQKVRYDGKHKESISLKNLAEKFSLSLIAFCPEHYSLGTPRRPVNLYDGDGGQVLKKRAFAKEESGKDVSTEFIEGAAQALAICQKEQISVAVLKENSPSCGVQRTYVSLKNQPVVKIPGQGVCAALLIANSISVFSEEQLREFEEYLKDYRK